MRARCRVLLIASIFTTICICGIAAFSAVAAGVDLPRWKVVSTKRGEMPQPGRISVQSGVVVADLRGDGTNAIVLASRAKPPALQAYYRAASNQWQLVVLDKNALPLESGGLAWDIDGDGSLDLVFGGDATSRQIWWWRNPGPKAPPAAPWERRLIKDSGAAKHQGMAFGSFLGDGKTQLAFWNQGARAIFLARIPDNPAKAGTSAWTTQQIYQPSLEEAGTNGLPTTIEAVDIDGDGAPDILSGNRWFKYQGSSGFKPTVIGDPAARSIAGMFKDARTPQIVTAPGETPGPLRIYECRGIADVSTNWVGRDLITNEIQHIDTLQAADLNGDGLLDIFCAETIKSDEKPESPRRAKPRAWILYGDGRGDFLVTELATNQEMHESKAADLDGDGDIDIVSKPFIFGAPGLEAWLNISAPQKIAGYGPSFRGPLGVQLSSVRREMGQNAPGALARLKQIGLRAVSLSGQGAAKPEVLHREIQRISLRLGGMHIPYARLKEDFQTAIADAKLLKPAIIVCQDIPHNGVMGESLARTILLDFKVWSQALRLEGLELGYLAPPEAFQDTPAGSFVQQLAKATEPAELSFELDAAALAHAGLNVGQILESLPKRIAYLVLADIAKTTANSPEAPALSPEDIVPLGAGSLDWPGILGAARKSGVRGYWLRDESLFPYDMLPKSLEFLENVKF